MGRRSQTIRNKRKIKVTNYHNDALDTSDANKNISKSFSRELKYTIISIFIVTIIMISSAFAIFSSVQKSEHYNTLTVGSLKVDFIDTDDGMGNIINLNGAYPESDDDGQAEQPYSFKITNSGTLPAGYTVKILDDTDMIAEDGCQDNLLDKSKIRISINGKAPITLSDTEANSYIISDGIINSGKSKNYSIRMWISDQAGNEVLGKHYHGKILVESKNENYTNENIKNAYIYDEANADTLCITGEEATCQVSNCYKRQNADSCLKGTIIKYAVNDSEEKYFYVLHDDGDKMTLQQRENTLKNIKWYMEDSDATKGPLTILPQLENATQNWTNVDDQTYTMGTTNFNGTNNYTGCSNYKDSNSNYNICDTNTYTLAARTAKARMITLQEASNLGCITDSGSCPKWMYNYLYQSISYGGTIDDDSINNNGYWTMNAHSIYPQHAWNVGNAGYVYHYETTETFYGARAVIVIVK